MSSDLRSLFRQSAAGQTVFNESRLKAIDGINQTYDRIEDYGSKLIRSDSYETLGIKCEDLHITEDGKYLDRLAPAFFKPLGLAHLPPILPTPSTQSEIARVYSNFGKNLNHPLLRSPMSQVNSLSSYILQCFRQFRRDVPRPDGEPLYSLMHATNWVPRDDISPSIIADEFGPVVWSSVWHPGAAWKSRKGSHVMFTLMIGREAETSLLKAELLTIAAVMITRLEGDECLEHNTIPVMAITIFAGWKVRVLEGYYSKQGLVIRKTGFLSFSSNKEGLRNLDILMGIMGSNVVGETNNPNNIIRIEPSHPIFPAQMVQGEGIRNLFQTRRGRLVYDPQSSSFIRESAGARGPPISVFENNPIPSLRVTPWPSSALNSLRRLYIRSDEQGNTMLQETMGHSITRSDEHELHRQVNLDAQDFSWWRLFDFEDEDCDTLRENTQR